MRVVTVRQPFASLIACGAKTLLDQARPTGYRGQLLIRAGSARPEVGHFDGYSVAGLLRGYTVGGSFRDGTIHDHMSFCRAHHHAAYELIVKDERWPLPLGVVVASCELVDRVPVIEKFSWLEMQRHGALVSQRSGGLFTFHRRGEPSTYRKLDDQFPLGDFAPGRHVWLLDDVRPTTERCPRCWGTGTFMTEWADGEPAEAWCSTCDGALVCPPVRMRGGPGLRTPEWEET